MKKVGKIVKIEIATSKNANKMLKFTLALYSDGKSAGWGNLYYITEGDSNTATIANLKLKQLGELLGITPPIGDLAGQLRAFQPVALYSLIEVKERENGYFTEIVPIRAIEKDSEDAKMVAKADLHWKSKTLQA